MTEPDRFAGRCETEVAYGYSCDLVINLAAELEAARKVVVAAEEHRRNVCVTEDSAVDEALAAYRAAYPEEATRE